MPTTFKRGDHVEWNSEAGRVRGVILKKVTADVLFKGYVHHASKDAPQYFIKSDKTDHVAIHKGMALTRIRPRAGRAKPKARIKKRTGREGRTSRRQARNPLRVGCPCAGNTPRRAL